MVDPGRVRTALDHRATMAVRRSCLLIFIDSFVAPSTVLAGMPAPDVLTDVASMRLSAISFFILLILLSAGGVQLLWNRVLRTSFTKLPRLTYGKSLGLIALWGLLFIVVLTMISGARELMTPGAWDRDGATYKLKPTSAP
jgi:hypothetical protein